MYSSKYKTIPIKLTTHQQQKWTNAELDSFFAVYEYMRKISFNCFFYDIIHIDTTVIIFSSIVCLPRTFVLTCLAFLVHLFWPARSPSQTIHFFEFKLGGEDLTTTLTSNSIISLNSDNLYSAQKKCCFISSDKVRVLTYQYNEINIVCNKKLVVVVKKNIKRGEE